MKGQKTTKILILGAIAYIAIVFLFPPAFALEKPSVKKGEIIHKDIQSVNSGYLSPIFTTDFKFNLVGFAWQGEENTKVSLRFYNAKGFSKWYSPEVTDYFTKDGWYYNPEPILAEKGSKIQYKIEEGKINQLKLIYLYSEPRQRSIFELLFFKAKAANTLNIISRLDWEADESYRLDGNNEEVWPVQYKTPQKFVIHHTAGSTGGDNPEAALRGVYYWHAVVLGWGDIGYNYVIDQQGNVYEGRFGGDGAIGAHVYRSQSCARERFGGEQNEANFNPGSIGIAVLGDYENILTLNTNVEESLATLITDKGKEFGISPNGEGYFVDNTYPNIVGHKDLDCTLCPGQNLYDKLAEIRTLAQEKYEASGATTSPVIKTTYISQSEKTISIDAGSEKEVWVDFRNDGNVTWHNYLQNFAVEPKSNSSLFYSSSWLSETKATGLDTVNVAPGEVGRFTFNIKAPADQLDVAEDFELVLNDQVLAGTNFKVKATVTGLPYAAALEINNLNPALFNNNQKTINLQYKNRGTVTWEKGQVKLNVYDLDDKVSRFYDLSWPSQSGQINFKENEVKPNELASFTFVIKTPKEPGVYKNSYQLVGKNVIIQKENSTITRVDSTYQAELISHNIPLAVLNFWRPSVVVKFRNQGLVTWSKDMVLNVYDLNEQKSKFIDSTWQNQAGQFTFKEKEVKPGKIATFEFKIKPPKTNGLYLQILKLEKKNSGAVIQNGKVSLITRVD